MASTFKIGSILVFQVISTNSERVVLFAVQTHGLGFSGADVENHCFTDDVGCGCQSVGSH